MKQYLLKVEVEPLEDGRYLAVCPELQGCQAEGETIADALLNIEDVARMVVELCREKGLPLPPELEAEDEPPVFRAELLLKVEA